MMNALMVFIDYPPRIQSGGVRASRLHRYLPDHGWQAHVLTMLHAPEHTDLHGGASTGVHRVAGPDLARWAARLRGRRDATGAASAGPGGPAVTGRRRFAPYVLPDANAFWVPPAVRAGLQLIRRHDIRVLYTSSPSESSLLVGFLLHSRTRLPWVVEFRDPWLLNPFRQPRPFRWLDSLEARLEAMVVRGADQLVVTSDEYRGQFLARYPSLVPEAVTWISNGFDPADYVDLAPEPFDHFTIVHAGKFYGERSSIDFLRGLQRCHERRPDLADRVRAVFVGTIDQAGYAFIQRAGLADVVELRGVRPHADALRSVAGAHVNLLIPGPGAGTMPAKIFEQIAVGRPILALVDEGPAKALIEAHGCGLCAGTRDVDAIAAAIARLHDSGPPAGVDPELRRRYAYPNIARRVADVLTRTLAAHDGRSQR